MGRDDEHLLTALGLSPSGTEPSGMSPSHSVPGAGGAGCQLPTAKVAQSARFWGKASLQKMPLRLRQLAETQPSPLYTQSLFTREILTRP